MKDSSRQEKIDICAAAAHQVNLAWCQAHGDYSQLPWLIAPEWQRKSARLGVIGVVNGNSPRQSHECWLAEKARDGWKYGPVKDADAKVHPCFVPYDELPPEQQAKDELFVKTVFGMALQLDLKPLDHEDVTQAVLDEVFAERDHQDEKWGQQNWPDGTGTSPNAWMPVDADTAKENCAQAFFEGTGTWFHILSEEVLEAMEETDPAKLRVELLQVAAVAVAWVEALDRRLGVVK